MFNTKGLNKKWDMYITNISHLMHAIKYNVDFSECERYDQVFFVEFVSPSVYSSSDSMVFVLHNT